LPLTNLTSPVGRGSTASLTIQTTPGTQCSITVKYASGASHAKGLGPQVAGQNGRCSWSWKVSQETDPGTWSVTVTAGGDSRTYPFVVQ
jgi:hypothetical protein